MYSRWVRQDNVSVKDLKDYASKDKAVEFVRARIKGNLTPGSDAYDEQTLDIQSCNTNTINLMDL